MKAFKKITAALTVIAIVLTLAFGASAGSLKQTISNTLTTLFNGTNTIGNTLKNVATHAVTDQDFGAAMKESAQEMGQNVKDIEKTYGSIMQVAHDAQDVYEGGKKIAEGVSELVHEGDVVSVVKYVTGKGTPDEKVTKAIEKMKEGYRQADNELITDAASLIPGGHYIMATVNVVKTSIERGAGYITEEEAEKKMQDQFIGTATHILTGGINEFVDDGGARFLIKQVTGAIADKLKELF